MKNESQQLADAAALLLAISEWLDLPTAREKHRQVNTMRLAVTRHENIDHDPLRIAGRLHTLIEQEIAHHG